MNRCFCWFKVYFKPSISLALNEIGDISAGNSNDDFQVTSSCLGGVDAEGNRLANHSIRYISHCYTTGVVSFDKEGAAFDVAPRQAYFDTVISNIDRAKCDVEFTKIGALWSYLMTNEKLPHR